MKPDLIVLHGALGASSQFDELSEAVSEHFNIHTFDFYGHGKNDADGSFSIDRFTSQLAQYLSEKNLVQPYVFGYSMGGYIALNLEKNQPDTFKKIVTLGTKFDWNPGSSTKEAGYLNADKIQEKIPHYAAYLDSLHHGTGWRKVLANTAEMMINLGKNPILSNSDLSVIQCEVTLTLGSLDNMVSCEETLEIKSKIEQAKYELLKGVPHPIDKIKIDDLKKLFSKEFSDVL